MGRLTVKGSLETTQSSWAGRYREAYTFGVKGRPSLACWAVLTRVVSAPRHLMYVCARTSILVSLKQANERSLNRGDAVSRLQNDSQDLHLCGANQSLVSSPLGVFCKFPAATIAMHFKQTFSDAIKDQAKANCIHPRVSTT